MPPWTRHWKKRNHFRKDDHYNWMMSGGWLWFCHDSVWTLTTESFTNLLAVAFTKACHFSDEWQNKKFDELKKYLWGWIVKWMLKEKDLSLANRTVGGFVLGVTRKCGNASEHKITNWLLLMAKYYTISKGRYGVYTIICLMMGKLVC